MTVRNEIQNRKGTYCFRRVVPPGPHHRFDRQWQTAIRMASGGLAGPEICWVLHDWWL